LNDTAAAYISKPQQQHCYPDNGFSQHEGIQQQNQCCTSGIYFGVTTYRISWPIRRTAIFSLGILEKNNDECILILVIYWKKTGLLHTKISKHNKIYSS